MSEIKQKKIIFADDLWAEIDEFSRSIDLAGESDIARSNPSYSMLLLGRREMLDMFSKWLSDNAIVLGLVLRTHGYENE